VDIQRKRPLDPEQLPQFWHPQRFGVEVAPARFRQRLQRINPNLDCTWGTPIERWLLWERNPEVTHYLCAGWSLRFVWQGYQNRYLPLDERVFANIYVRQLWRYEKGGLGYIDRIISEIERDRRIRKKDTNNESEARRRDYLQSHRISNLAGNKFALHHDGTIIPSRGEQNWRQELARRGTI
jgi:hypothetical protein